MAWTEYSNILCPTSYRSKWVFIYFEIIMARPRKENAEYFSHDTNMRSHRKIIALRNKYGIKWYAVYAMLLEHIWSCDYFTCKWDSIEQEILAWDFWVTVTEIIDIVSSCGRLDLVQIEWDFLKCSSMNERLSNLTAKRDRERNRVSVAVTTQPVAETPHSIVKNSIVKNRKEKEVIKEEEYFSFYKVNDLFKQFLEMRKSIKAYPTANAIWLLVKTLQKYNDDTKVLMLEKSIINQWKDVYPLKQEKPAYGKYTPPPWAVEWMNYKNQPYKSITSDLLPS